MHSKLATYTYVLARAGYPGNCSGAGRHTENPQWRDDYDGWGAGGGGENELNVIGKLAIVVDFRLNSDLDSARF